MFDFSDVIPVFAYAGLLLVLLTGFATVSYLAYAEGKRKRRRSRYGRSAEPIADSYFVDAASALAVAAFPAWAVHGLPMLRSFSQSAETHAFAMSPWSVALYWSVSFAIGFAYVRLLKRESPASTVGVAVAFLLSFFWIVWGFEPLNDLFVT
ncbi:MAG: hypothetical protein WA194_01125 [Patescibacteria group bacterium]